MSTSRAVALGGGHGLARTLAALPQVVGHITAVVTVADDGGSSGRLRRDLDVVRLEPADPIATPEAVGAIEQADLIVLGPGSLYTSVLPNLLVPGIGTALAAARASVVFVANLREQPGEKQGMSLTDHLDALEAHAPTLRLDAVVAHEGPAPAGDGLPRTTDPADLVGRPTRAVMADLLDGHDGHEPAALARVLAGILGGVGT